ncbi:hypothetical protein K7711_33605 [Nocardia sp. CA2R105]|nr:hypothetical protein [Nocardia coffeae]
MAASKKWTTGLRPGEPALPTELVQLPECRSSSPDALPSSFVGVRVIFEQIALMHMTMRMFHAVMGMGVFVFDVVMLVCGVSVTMGHRAVTVLVRMRLQMGVLVGHRRNSFPSRINQ